MSEIITVGLHLTKNVIQAHGADISGRPILREKLRRDQVLSFFNQLQPHSVSNTLSRPHCPKHSVEHSDSAQIATPQQQKNCATGVLRRNPVNRNHMCLILLGNLVAEEGLEPPTRGL